MIDLFGDEILNCYSGKRILVTGGAGYIATSLISLLKDIDCHILRLHRSDTPATQFAGKATIKDFIEDVRDKSIWKRVLQDVDIVFHFAAQTSVYVANEDPKADMNVNVLPMLCLLETCRQNRWKPIVLFSGTVTETGLPSHLPVDENHPDNPVTIYDLHKLMAENYLKYYVNQGLVRGAVLRLANVYGPGPESSSADRGVLNVMVRKALRREQLTIYGKGDYIRDYVYVEDVVRAFLLAGANIERLNGWHFVIGSGIGYTLKEAVDLVAKCVETKTGKQSMVSHIDPPTPQSPIESRNFVADSSRFQKATNWRPLVNLEQGIISMLETLL